MSRDPNASTASLFSQVSISPGPAAVHNPSFDSLSERAERCEQTRLLREMLASQDRQTELLEELVSVLGQQQRQRNVELNQWKQANPRLSQNCRLAAEALGKVQTEFLNSITAEVRENAEDMLEGDFMLNEFVDRFGPRLAHLNGVLQVLSHLSATAAPAANQEQ